MPPTRKFSGPAPACKGQEEREAVRSASASEASAQKVDLTEAEFQHSLLPKEERETHGMRENGAVVLISLARLKSLLKMLRCEKPRNIIEC